MYHLDVEKTARFVEFIFERLGLSNEYAKVSAEVIMQAEMTGVITHGLAKLPFYVTRYKNNTENLNPNIRQVNDHSNNILLDGDNASGLIVGPMALEKAIKTTKARGNAVVAVKNSGHFGCGNYYAWKLAKENLIGIVMTNTAPLMAPFGGKEREIGTNPIVATIPAKKNYPIVLDMATSVAAFGKIQIASAAGERIPPTWAKNINGIETTDPKEGLKGTLQPVAGHKGYGLAVIVDALTSLLSGGEFGRNIATIEELEGDSKEKISHFIMAIDPSTFYNLDDFLNHVDGYIDYMKNSPRADGVEEIFLPGEIEFEKAEKARKVGIELSYEQNEKLINMIKSLGIEIDDESLPIWIGQNF